LRNIGFLFLFLHQLYYIHYTSLFNPQIPFSIAKMTYTGIVMYPNTEDIQFNDSYYIKTHMPLVERTWKKYGLTSWRVTKFPKALDGSRSQYLIMATLEWENEESLKSALQDPGSAEVFGDIPNFSNVQPVTLAGSELQV
jgi:uncharacterized protein (TIGR02118 family)